jgi:hypothetical protein
MTLAVNIAQGGSNNVTFRNKIINGNMVIDQRNAGASVSVSSNTYTLDRYRSLASGGGVYSVQQSSTAPVGFTKSLLMTVTTTAGSLAAGNYYSLRQSIEGYNIADLGWGTANAKTVTLSFWVRSSLTGTFGGAVNNDNDASYAFTYTISSANTWEQKSITITGATVGTWATDNSLGLNLELALGVGSTRSGTAGTWTYPAAVLISATGATNVMATSGATLALSGIQLEAGTTASPFEYRQYTTEFTLCQRYYYKISVQSGDSASSCPFALGYTNSSSTMRPFLTFPTPMRVRPTSVETSGTASHYTVYYANDAAATCTAVPSFDVSSNLTVLLGAQVSGTPFPAGGITYLRSASTSAYLGFSAEL